MRFVTAIVIAWKACRALAALDGAALTEQYYGNDAPWYADRIPLFESSDQVLTDVYYYRWNIFRAHQRDLGANGYISTEFLDDVGWQTNPWASLNDATGFHLLEGRWCRDLRFKDDYATFIIGPDSNTRQFSESMADSIWKTYLVDANADAVISHLGPLETVYEAWADSFDTTKGLYWVEPLRDATEYTISSIDASGGLDGFTGGEAFRPSINSYQYGNAKAIASIAALAGGMQNTVDTYNERAADIKQNVQDYLWNSTFEHFIDRFYVNNDYVTYWNPIRGRELVGYVPWTHDLPDDNSSYAAAWTHALNPDELGGPYGLRTNEPSYEYYMRQYRYEGTHPECQWNGPTWPFQETQVLTGLANVLDHYPETASSVTTADYTNLLRQYAQLHYNRARGGVLNLEEDYNGTTGYPIVGLTRSPHYFHSGFIDQILSGFVGIRPRDDDVLEVNPLAASTQISYFRADRILYHGNDVAVQWDSTGSQYGTAGLVVEVNGAVVASSPTLTRLNVTIANKANPTVERPIAKSIQLQTSTLYPVGNVSVANASVERVHDTIDGRIWFFTETEVANGWETPAGNSSEQWYQINFGTSTETSNAEIAFFSNEAQGFDVPANYSIQVNEGLGWAVVSDAALDTPVANGITTASWTSATASLIRILLTPQDGKQVRLVEFKVY